MDRKLEILCRTNGPLATGCYIIKDGVATGCYIIKDGAKAYLVDAPSPADKLIDTLDGLSLSLEAVYLTHGHFDHIMAIPQLRRRYPDMKVAVSARDAGLLDRKACLEALSRFGIPGDVEEFPPPDILLEDGDETLFGYRVIATGGHTPGSVCFHGEDDRILFTGDTLFRGSVGRCDLGGDEKELRSSLTRLLEIIADDTTLLAGHGPSSTFGYEKAHNPFLM